MKRVVVHELIGLNDTTRRFLAVGGKDNRLLHYVHLCARFVTTQMSIVESVLAERGY